MEGSMDRALRASFEYAHTPRQLQPQWYVRYHWHDALSYNMYNDILITPTPDIQFASYHHELMLKCLRNAGLIAASIAISFLGAFTSTQLSVFPIEFTSTLVLQFLTLHLVCARRECRSIFQVFWSGQSLGASRLDFAQYGAFTLLLCWPAN